jgi:hypothetical protein
MDPQIWLGPPQEGKARSTVRIAESTQAIRLGRGETGRPPNFEQSNNVLSSGHTTTALACWSDIYILVSSNDELSHGNGTAELLMLPFTADMHRIVHLGRKAACQMSDSKQPSHRISGSFLLSQRFVWGTRSASARLFAHSSNSSSSARDLPAPHKK